MLYNSIMTSVATYSLKHHYGSLESAVVRVPQLDSLLSDMAAVLAKYRVY